ncbi:MAG: type II toxin-antitoxin system VapC family toxin [Actinomycetota bacterium]|nr:type II toxin-antitoxin system VapC family toxin [Actinomycetota bacterium]
MLVIDANVFLTAATSKQGFAPLPDRDLVGPPLLWSEARSALHVAAWRGAISTELAGHALSVIHSGDVKERRHRHLGTDSWRIADELGWAKTYDAEYLALASLLKSALATLDRRLYKAASQLGIEVLTPT